jgi:hypothetical protein
MRHTREIVRPPRPSSPSARLLMLVSFRLVIASGVLMLSTTQASSAGAQGRSDTTSRSRPRPPWRSSAAPARDGARRQRSPAAPAHAGDAQVQVRGGSRALVSMPPARAAADRRHLDITLPRGTALIVRTQSGDITVRGVGADVEVRTTSGNVTVDDAARVRIETVAGDVSLRNVRDGARVNATSGDVELSPSRETWRSSATSSTVMLRDVDSRRVDVKVVSGDVRWTGTVRRIGSLRLQRALGRHALRAAAQCTGHPRRAHLQWRSAAPPICRSRSSPIRPPPNVMPTAHGM